MDQDGLHNRRYNRTYLKAMICKLSQHPLKLRKHGKTRKLTQWITFRAESSILDLFSNPEFTAPSHLLEFSMMLSESSLISEPKRNISSPFASMNTSVDFVSQMNTNDLDNAIVQSSKNLENHVGAAEIDMESIQHNMDIVDLQHDVADHNPRDNTSCTQEVPSVPETWRKLKNCCENSKLSTRCQDVSVVTT